MHQVLGDDMITGMGFIGTKTGGLYRMNGRRTVKKTASGNPITLTDSAENKLLGMKLYGWSKQDGEPSPENPVEIESAGMKWSTGKNLFHVTKESDCDKTFDNTTKRIILSGEYLIGLSSNNYHTVFNASIDLNTYSISFIYDGRSGYGVGIGTNCQKNKTYAFSFETNKGMAYAVFYSEDGKYKASVLISKYNVFVIPDYAAYVVIVLVNNNSAVSGNTIWFKNIQIEESSSPTTYEPYTGGIPKPYGDKVGIGVYGKNLFDERLLDDESNYNKQYQSLGYWILAIPVKNGPVTVSVKNTTNWGGYLCVNSTGIVGDVGGVWMAHGSVSHLKRTVTLTITHGFVYLLMSKGVDTNKRTLEEVGYIQVEYGTEATSYEPYRTTQSTSIITPNGLPGIPVPSNTAGITYTDADGQAWIADDIDLERGKYVQRVWQAEFDGSKDEAWAVSGTTFYSPSLPTNMKFRDGVTNKYAVRNVQNIQCVNFGRGNTALCVANPSEYDGSLDDKGLSNFKAHLAANPLKVMTYLDTPIERNLTSAELAEYIQLYSYKPTTVVENDSDCWMDVTYRGKK
jgi:hypothetical protein